MSTIPDTTQRAVTKVKLIYPHPFFRLIVSPYTTSSNKISLTLFLDDGWKNICMSM